eukprot:CAMPEP_0177616762 /NCGR_PEP_ID=MMETSP0419_2-20121207/24393_1 /TAXON_ID=582737 /ORGANISM="Tetraselmis sp., Strain GSL018" /LENGTH=49 /DNA_ID= /DNA_START= /DNA_END= /DNA_ORIENTATION=
MRKSREGPRLSQGCFDGPLLKECGGDERWMRRPEPWPGGQDEENSKPQG